MNERERSINFLRTNNILQPYLEKENVIQKMPENIHVILYDKKKNKSYKFDKLAKTFLYFK